LSPGPRQATARRSWPSATPFFAPRAGRDRIGALLTGDTNWAEIRELVTESYRLLAPKKLCALLE